MGTRGKLHRPKGTRGKGGGRSLLGVGPGGNGSRTPHQSSSKECHPKRLNNSAAICYYPPSLAQHGRRFSPTCTTNITCEGSAGSMTSGFTRPECRRSIALYSKRSQKKTRSPDRQRPRPLWFYLESSAGFFSGPPKLKDTAPVFRVIRAAGSWVAKGRRK